MFESREALSLGEGTTLPMWATLLPLEFGLNRAVINQKKKFTLFVQLVPNVEKDQEMHLMKLITLT